MEQRKPKLLDGAKLLDYAARLLSGRAYTTGEMREKLRRKASDPGDVAGVLDRLKELGYLDDRRFAQDFAALRRNNEGVGKMRVLRGLHARRVAPALAGKAVEDAYRGADETALIEAWLARKFRGRELGAWLSEEKHLLSAFRRLRTAGFSAGNSIRVLRKHARESAEALDALESQPPEGGAE